MSQSILLLTDRFRRLRVRTAPVEQRSRWAGMLGAPRRLRGLRANPDLVAATAAHGALERVAIALHNGAVRRRWRRELGALDERLLRDIGLSRAEAERAVRKRPGAGI